MQNKKLVTCILLIEKEICEPPAAKRPRRSRGYTTKRKKEKDQKKTPSQRMNDAIHKIKEDMRRATEDKTFDGLSQVFIEMYFSESCVITSCYGT